MNLRVTGIGEERPFFVGAIGRGDVAAARIGREIENVSVAAGREDDGVARVRLDLSGDQASCDDPFGVSVDQNEIEHLRLRKHLDGAGCDLAAQRLIGAEEKLLARLPPRVKRARDLRAAEGAIGQQPAIFTGKGHALLDALVDDQIADFREPIDVRLPRAEVAALDCVVKEAEDAVAVVLIIFRGIDSALGGDAMSAARAVLVTEALHVVTELAQRCRGSAAGQAAAHDDYLKFPAIVRTDQAGVILMRRPFIGKRAGRDLGVQAADHNCWAGFTQCSKTATGMEV